MNVPPPAASSSRAAFARSCQSRLSGSTRVHRAPWSRASPDHKVSSSAGLTAPPHRRDWLHPTAAILRCCTTRRTHHTNGASHTGSQPRQGRQLSFAVGACSSATSIWWDRSPTPRPVRLRPRPWYPERRHRPRPGRSRCRLPASLGRQHRQSEHVGLEGSLSPTMLLRIGKGRVYVDVEPLEEAAPGLGGVDLRIVAGLLDQRPETPDSGTVRRNRQDDLRGPAIRSATRSTRSAV